MQRFRLTPRCWLRLRSERGIALPMAMMMLFIVSTLAVVVASSATTSNTQSIRDRGVKRGVAAADAGVDAGLYRLNKLQPLPNQCVTVNQGNGSLQVQGAGSNGWCPAQTENLGDDASYSYEMSTAQNVTVNGQNLYQRRLVSTGVVNGIKRRVLTVVGASTGRPLVGDYALISLSNVFMGQTTRIQGNLGTNGNVTLRNEAEVCGNITYGIGKKFERFNTAHQCPGFTAKEATQPFVLSPVGVPESGIDGNDRINNSNPLQRDSSTPYPLGGWDSARRVLSLGGTDTLTLSGNVYVFCKLEIRNAAQLIIGLRPPTAPPVKIYIDSPDSPTCRNVFTGSGPFEQVHVGNTTSISNANSDPTTLTLFAAGSSDLDNTTLSFEQEISTQLPMIIYAPRSKVDLKNGVSILGAVAAHNIFLWSRAQITYDPRISLVTVDDVLPQYTPQSWVECRVERTDPAVPDSGC
jgi:Tfp pilus assembly protein PilX